MSSTLWWDGIFNPLFHGMAFFALSSGLGYLADLGEALIERAESEPERPAEPAPKPAGGGGGVPNTTPPRPAGMGTTMPANPLAARANKPIDIGDDIPTLTETDLRPDL